MNDFTSSEVGGYPAGGRSLLQRRQIESVRRDITQIIQAKAITAHFQPIVISGVAEILGYEGLTRGPSGSYLHSPTVLFDMAAQTGQLVDLERCALSIIAQRFAELALPGYLFVNLSADTFVANPRCEHILREVMDGTRIPHSRVVAELTENRAIDDAGKMHGAIEELRNNGFLIALDDLGSGFGSLQRWSMMRPDFVKIDRHFIDGVAGDPLKQQFVRSIMDLARSSGCAVIAEGVEEEADFCILRQIGVTYYQGYLFGKPQPAPRKKVAGELEQLLACGEHPRHVFAAPSKTAGELARRAPTVNARLNCSIVVEMLRSDPHLYSLPVLDDDGRPIGLIRSFDALSRAVKLYFMEVFGKRSCVEIMDRSPLVFDASASLHVMANALTELDERYLVDGFLVTVEGRYFGTGRTSDLLKAVSDLQLLSARHANPLTSLPGNVPINDRVDTLLSKQASFVVAYWDLGSFKAFNDTYGYRAGDEVIQFTARVLSRVIDPEVDFLGHVGGDDFVMILQGDVWEHQLHDAVAMFDEGVQDFFTEEHRQAGGYMALNRQEVEVFHPLVTLAAGVVEVSPLQYESHRHLAQQASEAKRMAKKEGRSCYFVERRNNSITQQAETITAREAAPARMTLS